jgi:hypothetical protein
MDKPKGDENEKMAIPPSIELYTRAAFLDREKTSHL